MKREGYRCERCGDKQSKAKGKELAVKGHHKRPPNWHRMYKVIREELLQTSDDWQILCTFCHNKEHEEKK